MGKIQINLLPSEVVLLEKDIEKRALAIRASVAILVIVTILSLTALVIRLTQKISLTTNKHQLDLVTEKVQALKEQEGVVSILKQRVNSISGILGETSKQEKAFKTLIDIFPKNIKLLSMSIDKTGKLDLNCETENITDLDDFFQSISKIGRAHV